MPGTVKKIRPRCARVSVKTFAAPSARSILSYHKSVVETDTIMTRRYIDCREFPSEKNCTVEISADTEDEVMDVAVMHAVATHQHKDTPELRKDIRGLIRSRDEALA